MDNNPGIYGMVSGTTNYTWDGNGNLLSATNTVNTAKNKSFPVVRSLREPLSERLRLRTTMFVVCNYRNEMPL